MESFTIGIGGHDYTVWVDENGKVTHTACKFRWTKTDVPIGDLWLENKLQNAANANMLVLRKV